MQLFGVYIFNERFRKDKKQGDMVFIIPCGDKSIDNYGVPRVGYTNMLYMAESVYFYDIDEDEYRVLKNRSGSMGMTIQKPFMELVSTNDVILLNQSIGKEDTIDSYLFNQRNPHVLPKKFMKISLAGLDQPELYFSALCDWEET